MTKSRRIFLLLLISLCLLQSFTQGSRHSNGHGRSHGRHRDSYERHYPRHRSRHSSSRPSNQIHPEREQSDEKQNQELLMTPYKNPITDSSSIRSVNDKENVGDDKSDDRNTITVNRLTPGVDKNDNQAGTINVNSISKDDDSNTTTDGINNANGLSSDDDGIGSLKNKPDSEDNPNNIDEINPTNNGNSSVSVDGKLPSKDPNLSDFPNGNDTPNQDESEMDKLTSNADKPTPSDVTPRPNFDNNSKDDVQNMNGGGIPDNDQTKPEPNLKDDELKPSSDKDKPNNMDDSNNIGLLPGGDGENPDKGSSDVDQFGLADLGEPDHDNTDLDGFKPNDHRPGTNNVNDGSSAGQPQNTMPDAISSTPRSNHHDNNKRHRRPKEPNYNAEGNSPALEPVYLLENSGRLTTTPQKNQVPAFYIVMIDGHATLVRNPGFVDRKPINVLPHEPVPVPQMISPPVYPQPVPYPIPEAGAPFMGYPNMPYPQMYPNLPNVNVPSYPNSPNPQMYPNLPNVNVPSYPNSPNQNMNWPGIIDFLINLGQHIQQPSVPVPKPGEPNSTSKPEINDVNPTPVHNIDENPTTEHFISTDEPISPQTELPIPEPDQEIPTEVPPQYEFEPWETEPWELDNNENIYPEPDDNENIYPEPDNNENIYPEPDNNENIYPEPDNNENIYPEPDNNENIYPEPDNNENIYPKPDNNENIYPEPDNNENIYPEPDNNENVYPDPDNHENIYPEPDNNENIYPESDNNENIYPEPDNNENIYPEPDNNENIYPEPDNNENINPEPDNNENIYHEPDNNENIYPGPDMSDDAIVPQTDANDEEPSIPDPTKPLSTEEPVQPDTNIINNEPNHSEELNKPTPGPKNPDIEDFDSNEWLPIFDDKPIPPPVPTEDEHVQIPIEPKPNHSGKSKTKPGSFDIALLNVLNNILKLPNRVPSSKPKPSKDEKALVKLLLAIMKPNSEDKDSEELLQKMSHFSPLSKHLIQLLGGRTQPNFNILVEPGMDEATRSNTILLLNLLASNLASDYSPSMAYYEQMNAANPLLQFLGHIPCDHRHIRPLSTGHLGLRKNLWHMLSNMYGFGDMNSFRLGRSASEDANEKATTATSIDIKK